MMQGDQYGLPIEISTDSGVADGSTFDDVEIYIGRIRKTLKAGEIKYSAEKKAFIFPLEQQETMLLRNGGQLVQIRVKMPNGDVMGIKLPDVDVIASASKVVL